jgi:hypothetical protein
MALLLNNTARHYIPGGPMCLSKCRGIRLKPGLLSALKFSARTVDSSAAEICWEAVLQSGVNSSGVMVGSKNIDSLNLTKSTIGITRSLVTFDLSMLQNYLGRCFNMLGRSNCIHALLALHAMTNSFSALLVCACHIIFGYA